MTTTRLPPIDRAVAVANGFIGLEPAYEPTTGDSPSRVVRITPDGTRTVLTRFGVAPELAASPDGLTVAVSDDGKGLITLDARTGRRLGRWVPPKGAAVMAVGWTPRGLLAVASPTEQLATAAPTLIAFDASLRPITRRANLPTGWRTVVGDSLVTFRNGRLAVTPPSGPLLEADELRLARADGVVGVPGEAFTAEAAGVRPPRTPIRVRYDGTGSPGPGVGVLALGALAAAAVVRIVWRARPRGGGQR